MIEKILKNLDSIEFKINAIRDLFKYHMLDKINLKHYGKMLNISIKELNDNIEKYY